MFQDRILSRDESGSFTIKSIQRLFPCDQSMVVVVDDRADVWCYIPNLIKVKPYDFFVGIGDINDPSKIASADDSKPDVKPLPLFSNDEQHPNIVSVLSHDHPIHPVENSELIYPKKKQRPSLDDSDNDLHHIEMFMIKIHDQFYKDVENTRSKLADVRTIIPSLKSKILRGGISVINNLVHILFSGIIPLDIDPLSHELWVNAVNFGAVCHLELSNEVTHLIAAKVSTIIIIRLEQLK